MSADLHIFPGTQALDANTILELAKQGGLKDVVVIGFDQNDKMFISTSIEQPVSMLWIIERAMHFFRKKYFDRHDS